MRALTPRLLFTGLLFGAMVGCAVRSQPVTVDVGIHRVSFIVPEGFTHYDHGREQRLERTEGDLVLTDLGPVTADGFRRVIGEARKLSGAGRIEDAATLLRDLRLWKVLPEDQRDRRFSIAVELVVTERTVKAHVSNLLGKLHLSDRTQAAIYAWREGLMKE